MKWLHSLFSHPPYPKVMFIICLLLFHVSLSPSTSVGSEMQMLEVIGVMLQTLEHIIFSNINKHISLENILADCQHGFRSQRSCETQLIQFFHDMVSNLDRAQNRGHRQTDVIIMDFAKAFDKVPHKRLLYKLHYYGIRGSTHKWIASWLSERYQK